MSAAFKSQTQTVPSQHPAISQRLLGPTVIDTTPPTIDVAGDPAVRLQLREELQEQPEGWLDTVRIEALLEA